MQKVNFGKRVENVRVLLNLSQKELANELNCSQSVISNWELNVGGKPLEKYVKAFYSYCDLNNIKFLGNQAKFGTTQEIWRPNEITPIEKEQDDAINKICDTITDAVNNFEIRLNEWIWLLNGNLTKIDNDLKEIDKHKE